MIRNPDPSDAGAPLADDRYGRFPCPSGWLERIGRCFGRPMTGVAFLEAQEPSRLRSGAVRLATALDRCTVRVDPVVRHASPNLRFLILAHELAHTVQLARHGNDPEEALEREAWEAAASVWAGRRFVIRGAASRPLDAKAFVAANMAPAIPYYQRFRQEPGTDRDVVVVDSVTQVESTAAGLFSTLRQGCRRGDTLLIVAHSSEHGVALRLVTGSQLGLNVDNVNRIMRVVLQAPAARAAGMAELARDARLDPQAASSLVGDIAAVRALGLTAVHFRGCNLGAWEDTPRVFRELFGCSLVTGLNLRSAYAGMTPGVMTGTPQARSSRFNLVLRGRSSARTVVEGAAGQRFGYRYSLNLERHSLAFSQVVAESAQATEGWIRRHFPTPQPAYTSGRIPVHALLSVGDLIFPFDNGRPSSEYTSHIRVSRPGSDIL